MNNKARRRDYQEKYKIKFSHMWFIYCRDPLENIEGWDRMLNDTSGTVWHLHHRDEISEDGEVVSRDELISRGEYYNLPASKLIFLTESEHKSKHNSTRTGKNNPMHGKTGKLAPGYGRTGEKHPCSKPIEVDGVIYCSRTAAADALEKSRVTIHNWLQSGRARYI